MIDDLIMKEVTKDQYYICIFYQGKEFSMNLEKSDIRHLIQKLDNGII